MSTLPATPLSSTPLSSTPLPATASSSTPPPATPPTPMLSLRRMHSDCLVVQMPSIIVAYLHAQITISNNPNERYVLQSLIAQIQLRQRLNEILALIQKIHEIEHILVFIRMIQTHAANNSSDLASFSSFHSQLLSELETATAQLDQLRTDGPD